MNFVASSFILPYIGTDKILTLQTSTLVKVGGFSVCQYVKSATEAKELIVYTSLGKLVLKFNTEADAKLAQNLLNIALESLVGNCSISIPSTVVTGAKNGLSLESLNVKLGGTLTEITTISQSNFDFFLQGGNQYFKRQSGGKYFSFQNSNDMFGAGFDGIAQIVSNNTTLGSSTLAGLNVCADFGGGQFGNISQAITNDGFGSELYASRNGTFATLLGTTGFIQSVNNVLQQSYSLSYTPNSVTYFLSDLPNNLTTDYLENFTSLSYSKRDLVNIHSYTLDINNMQAEYNLTSSLYSARYGLFLGYNSYTTTFYDITNDKTSKTYIGYDRFNPLFGFIHELIKPSYHTRFMHDDTNGLTYTNLLNNKVLLRSDINNPNGSGILQSKPTFEYSTNIDTNNAIVGVNSTGEFFNTGKKIKDLLKGLTNFTILNHSVGVGTIDILPDVPIDEIMIFQNGQKLTETIDYNMQEVDKIEWLVNFSNQIITFTYIKQ